MSIARVQYYTLGTGVFGAPVVQCFKQLLAKVFALVFRMNAQQRQHVVGPRRQAGDHCIVVFQIAFGATEAGGQQHAHAPAPAFGDVHAPLWRSDQRHADQSIVDKQANRRQVFGKVLLHQLTYRGAHALVIAWPLGFKQVGKGGVVTIGVIKQRACFAGIATIEHTYFGETVGHLLDLCCS